MGETESKLPPNPELDKPWRIMDWGNTETLKQKLENFTPKRTDVQDIKIMVAGQTGAGMSSFINSVESAFRGEISSRALVNSDLTGHSCTRRLKGLTINGKEKPLPYVFKDVMGLQAGTFKGAQPDDIISAVFGHLKDGYEFGETQPLSYKDPDFKQDPSLSDQCFCLVYVIDAGRVHLLDEKVFDKLRTIRMRLSDRGIPQVIVMTKVDEACPLVNKDLKMIYRSKKIKEKMEFCCSTIGVPMSNIFPVKNYNEEIETNDDADLLLLKALEQIVWNANNRLQES